MTFWCEFLVNLLATLIGVFAGGLFALRASEKASQADEVRRATARKAEAERRMAEKEADEKQLARLRAGELSAAIGVLQESLAKNAGSLSQLAQSQPGNRAVPQLLDSAVWDALKNRVSIGIQSADLVQRLAYHWLQLEYLNRMHRDILEHDIVGSLRGEELKMLTAYRTSWASVLHAQAVQLSTDLALLYPASVNTTD